MARLSLLDAARAALMEAGEDPNAIQQDPTETDGYIWVQPLPDEIQWRVQETVMPVRVCLHHFQTHIGSSRCDAVLRFTRDCGRRH